MTKPREKRKFLTREAARPTAPSEQRQVRRVLFPKDFSALSSRYFSLHRHKGYIKNLRSRRRPGEYQKFFHSPERRRERRKHGLPLFRPYAEPASPRRSPLLPATIAAILSGIERNIAERENRGVFDRRLASGVMAPAETAGRDPLSPEVHGLPRVLGEFNTAGKYKLRPGILFLALRLFPCRCPRRAARASFVRANGVNAATNKEHFIFPGPPCRGISSGRRAARSWIRRVAESEGLP